MAEEELGFLGRWSRRKQEVRAGRPVSEPQVQEEGVDAPAQRLPPLSPIAKPQASSVNPVPAGAVQRPTETALAESPPQTVPVAPAPPTLEDVQTLTPQSDYTRFMASDVEPQVKNAAMKKLFADPHFNVMDRMDIYIDDYNQPDPLPAAMLRKLASAQFLNLFDDEKKEATDNNAPDGPAQVLTDTRFNDHPDDRVGTDSDTAPHHPTTPDHDDTDLRLQQDHAAGPQGSGGDPQ